MFARALARASMLFVEQVKRQRADAVIEGNLET